MSRGYPGWQATLVMSLLAAFATWVTLFSWRPFVEMPSGYLVPLLLAGLIVAGVGAALRSVRTPWPLVPFAQVVALLLWLNRTWAPDLSAFGWLPTASSLRELSDRVALGTEVAQQYAAPVPADEPVVFALLIAAGAATMVVVDLFACGFRRASLAGLPLLLIYTVPLGIVDTGVPGWVFAVGALSFLLLLATQESHRLRHWGRQLAAGDATTARSSSGWVGLGSVGPSARRIGVVTTGLALVLPVLIPTLDEGFLDGRGPGSGGNGDAVGITNPMVDLRRDLVRGEDVDLVRLETDRGDPSYLRISVLDEFDGNTWKPSSRDIPVEQRAEGLLPLPPGLGPDVDRTEVAYTVAIEPEFESRWLPAPYPASFLDVDGDWRYDVDTLDFVSADEDQTTGNLIYELRALEVDIDPATLAEAGPAGEAIFTPNTALPNGTPESVRELAEEVTAGRESDFEQAVRLQEWFREDGDFTYSTERSAGNGLDDLEQFLGEGPEGRIGYCEQFAAAMAVMGRAIGIPSRVAVGFLRPEQVDAGRYVYSAHDLHAWPEMYFEGTGWVRFEPTPQSRATTVPGYTTEGLAAPEPAPEPTPAVPPQELNRFNQQPQALDPAADAAGQSVGPVRAALPWLAGLVLLTALALAPRTLRRWLRRRRWARAGGPREVAEAAWLELRATALDLGIGWDDRVSVRAMARSLVNCFGAPDRASDGTSDGASDGAGDRTTDSDPGGPRPATGARAYPEATTALEHLVHVVEEARYARSADRSAAGAGAAGEPQLAGAEIDRDLRRCVEALRAGASAGRRRRATWLPRSLTGRVSRGTSARALEPIRATSGSVDHAV